MDYRGKDNGWGTFLEHWGMLIVVLTSVLASQALVLLMNLTGTPWIWTFSAGFALMIAGGGLVTFAKLPLYRSGRFLTFGMKAIPAHLKSHYRWGWRLFLAGVVLSLCLLLSRH